MHLSAHAEASLAHFKAALAANAHVSDEELLSRLRRHRTAAPSDRLPPRRTPKPRAPRRRAGQLPPRPSRQYARAISMLVSHDKRLPPNCTRLALEIVALAGTKGWVETTKSLLAHQLDLHPRTIGKLLAALRAYGYVCTEETRTRMGSHAGLRITVLPLLIPYYRLENSAAAIEPYLRRFLDTHTLQDDRDLPQSAPSRPPNRGTG
jgi:hypothetical protein